MNLQLKDVTYKGSTAMGGIAHSNNGTITACSVTGTLTNTTNNGDVGGIAAINYGTITACWFNGTITGGSNVGVQRYDNRRKQRRWYSSIQFECWFLFWKNHRLLLER